MEFPVSEEQLPRVQGSYLSVLLGLKSASDSRGSMIFTVRTNEETEAQQWQFSRRTAWAPRPTPAPFRRSIPIANAFVGLPSLPKGQEKAVLWGTSLPSPAGPADIHPPPGSREGATPRQDKQGLVMNGSADRGGDPRRDQGQGTCIFTHRVQRSQTTRGCPPRHTGV